MGWPTGAAKLATPGLYFSWPFVTSWRETPMLGLGWLTIRQAQEALKSGQLDEAHRLLCQSGVHGHKKSFELMQQVGRAFVERGDKHLKQDDPESAWGDLLLAEQLGLKDDP